MGKMLAILKLTRMEHSVMLVLAIIAAELIVSAGLPTASIFILSLITPVAISSAAFAINDYFDIKVDKMNKKKRPLVDGSLKPMDAIYVTILGFGIGIIASLFINIYCFVIAIIFAVLAFLYSYKLKEVLLLGNLYIAFSMAIPFIFGNYVVSYALSQGILLIAATIFLSGVAREIHGTIRDYKGDLEMRNANTVPRAIGIKSASALALTLYIIAIALSYLLYVYLPPLRFNLAYAIPIALTDILLLYVGVGYLAYPNQKFYDKTRNISLIAMGIAIIAFLLAGLFYI